MSALPDWSRLTLLQRGAIVGSGVALALHVVFTVGLVGFMVAIAPEGKGLFVLKWVGPNALLTLVGGLIGSALVVLLTVKIGGPDKPLRPLRLTALVLFYVGELTWAGAVCLVLYAMFISHGAFPTGTLQLVGAAVSAGALIVGIVYGFTVWGVTALVAKH